MNCLIIDDNIETTRSLEDLLLQQPGIEKVHRAAGPNLVPSLVAIDPVDLIFIRARLWDFRPFRKLKKMPVVVFLSAGKERLTGNPDTAVPYDLRQPYQLQAINQLLFTIRQAPVILNHDFLMLQFNGRLHKVCFDDIELVERKPGSYVILHLRYGSWMVPGSLVSYLKRLPEDRFVRLSDTLIVPGTQVTKTDGDVYEFQGRKIKLSYRFAAKERNRLQMN